MYSHIIFDLDGTLIESLPGIATALNTALAEHKLPTHSTGAVRTFIGDGSHTLCARAAADQSEETIEKIHQIFLKQYPTAWKSGTHVFEGIQDLVHSLKSRGCSLSILSNKPHSFTTEMVEHFFPNTPFDLVLGQREGVSKKPDPSGVHELLGELGHSSNNSVLIGDSTIDIVTARNAGISSIAVTWGYHNLDQLSSVSPKYIAKSIAELMDILTPKNVPTFR
ncbi:MAG: HAD family hydrolase [Rubritalea sp.]|uniref:HAD family hydrolase n=1 Tax=Rubritalea sp. TaxID=2109375 RepID=UPI003242B647